MKGFITIAFGRYYWLLAENLILSYRLNVPKDNQLPFCIITDKENDKVSEFDKVIISTPSEKGFMNKLRLAELTPYQKTIFIDADSLVYKDISFWFDKYEENGSAFSSFGRNIGEENVHEINNILFDISKAKKEWDYLAYIPFFNAATYYLDKSTGGGDICETAKRLYYSGVDYGYPFFGDETYISLAMAIHSCKCCMHEGSAYFGSHAEILYSDIIKKHYKLIAYGKEKDVELLHWSTFKTHHPLYQWEALRVRAFLNGGEAELSKLEEEKARIYKGLNSSWRRYARTFKLKGYIKAIKVRLNKFLKKGS